MKVGHTTFSEIGKRRANQDVCRVIEIPEHNRALMIVCDGMGGHSMGDVAAETVCNVISEFWVNNHDVPDSETKVTEAYKVTSDAFHEQFTQLKWEPLW